MVRLEKLIYEQVFNQHMIKRGRTLAAPSKWYSENRWDAMQVAGQKLTGEGVTGFLFKFLEPLLSRFTYQWYRDHAFQRGFALEDFFLHQDRELRRCFLFEKMARESLHPYQWIFQKKRRARYYKVERALRGTYVPDWARKEGEARLFCDTAVNKAEWETFVYKEYMSDMTPNFHWSVMGKWSVLEMFIPYGLWRGEAWDRYFLNEKYYTEYTQDTVDESMAKIFPQDLSTTEGRLAFESEVNRFIDIYPGSVVEEGESYDFQRYYAKQAVLNGTDSSSYDQGLISDLKSELEASNVGLIEGDAPKTGSGRSIGSINPAFITEKSGKGYFAN